MIQVYVSNQEAHAARMHAGGNRHASQSKLGTAHASLEISARI